MTEDDLLQAAEAFTAPAPPAAAAAPVVDEPADDLLGAAEAFTAEQQTQIRAAATQTGGRKPDDFAEARRLSADLGIAPRGALSDLELARRRASLQRRASYVGTPLGDGLRDPVFAQLVDDGDIDTLAEIQKLAAPQAEQGFLEKVQAKRDDAELLAIDAFQRIRAQRAAGADTVDVIGGGLRRIPAQLRQGAYGAAGWAADIGLVGVLAPLFGAGWSDDAADKLTTDATDALAERATSAGADAEQIKLDLGRLTYAQARLLDASTSVGMSLPLVLAALPTGGASLAAGLPAAAFGVQAGGQTWSEDYEKGLEPWKRALHAPYTGAVEAALEYFPEKLFLGELKAGAPIVKAVLKNIALQIGSENATTLLQNLGDYVAREPDKSFAEFLGEQPRALLDTTVTTAMAAGFQSSITAGVESAGNFLATREEKARTAEARAQQLEMLAKYAKASKLRERDPASFETFVGRNTDGTPLEQVYVDPERLTEVLNQVGVTPEQLAEQLPDVAEQLETALATGTDVQLDTAQFLARMSGVEGLDTALVPHLKVEPDGFTRAEGEAYAQEQETQFEEAFNRAASAADVDYEASARRVRDAIYDQLQATQRFTAEEHAAQANLLGAFYSTYARRAGMTPEQLYSGAGRLQIESSPIAEILGGALAQAEAPIGLNDAVLKVHELFRPPVARRLLDEAESASYRDAFGDAVPETYSGKDWRKYKKQAAAYEARVQALVAQAQTPGSVIHRMTEAAQDLQDAQRRANELEKGTLAAVAQAQREDEQEALARLRTDISQGRVTDAEVMAAVEGLTYSDDIVEAIDTLLDRRDTELSAPPANDPLRQAGGAKVRGQFDPKTRTLRLLRDADLSTFHHETGHFFLETLAELAAGETAPQQIKDDFDTFLKWRGVPDAAAWQGMSLDAKREHHEAFARGFERYLFEGKAPSIALRGVFARTRSWMVSVYRKIKGTPIEGELPQEIRQVYDRLLATDDEIAQAQALAGVLGQLEADDIANAERINQLAEQSTEDAIADMTARSLRDMKWLTGAKSRALKELQAQAAAARKEVQSRVAEQVRAEPVYAAQRFLKTGELHAAFSGGEETRVDAGHRLSIPQLEALYSDPAGAPDWRALGTGRYGMLGKEGIDVDLIAGIFGYGSADQMIREILAAPAESQRINDQTDATMLQEHSELADPESLQRAAESAIHNEARAKAIATTLAALEAGNRRMADTGTGRRTNVVLRAAKEFAAARIENVKLRMLKPRAYQASEKRALDAARTALKKPGGVQEAIRQQRNALVNNQLAREGLQAQAEINQGLRYLRKFGRPGTRKALLPEYNRRINELLSMYGLAPADPRLRTESEDSLQVWVNAELQNGVPLGAVSANVIDPASAAPYQEMRIADFRNLVSAVKNLEHVGRLSQKLLTSQDKFELGEIVEKLAANIRANTDRRAAEQWASDRGALVGAGRLGRNFLAVHRIFASLIAEIDGFKDGGHAWETLVRPMNARSDQEAGMNAEAMTRLAGMLKALTADGESLGATRNVFLPKRPTVPLTREAVLGIALNMGTELNRERVVTGEGLSAAQLTAILDTLTPADLAFVKEAWAMFRELKPQAEAKQLRMTGVKQVWQPEAAAPELAAVAARLGVDIGEGGYYPIAYDSNRDERTEQLSAADAAKMSIANAFRRPQTRQNYLKDRVTSTGRPLRYDLGVLGQELNHQIHDIVWAEWLYDARRVIGHKVFRAAMRETYGPELLKQMDNQMLAIATGNQGAVGAIGKVIAGLRRNVSVAGLAFNLTNVLINLTGLSQSAARIGVRNLARGMTHWAGNAAQFESSLKDIYARSEFMRLRGQTLNRELSESSAALDAEVRGGLTRGLLRFQRVAYILQIQTQKMVDVPTWYGAYEGAMQQDGMTEAKAIALADQAVRDSQGSGNVADMADIMRSSEAAKLLTSFYSFFNTTYNLNVRALRRGVKEKSLSGWLDTAVSLTLLNVIPAILGTAINAALRGYTGDDDDDFEWEKFFKHAGLDFMSYVMGQLVGVRELTAAAQNLTGLQRQRGYSGPAAIRLIDTVTRLSTQAQQGDADGAARRAAIDTAGLLFGLPSTQINRTWDGIIAAADGEAGLLAPLVGPPIK